MSNKSITAMNLRAFFYAFSTEMNCQADNISPLQHMIHGLTLVAGGDPVLPTPAWTAGYKLPNKRRQEDDIPMRNFCTTGWSVLISCFCGPHGARQHRHRIRVTALAALCKQLSIFLTYVYRNCYIMRRH
jgi:hypothetical protein